MSSSRPITKNLAIVDSFGSLLWTGAIYSVSSGFVIDYISSRLNRPLMEAKTIALSFFIVLDNVLGIGIEFAKHNVCICTEHLYY